MLLVEHSKKLRESIRRLDTLRHQLTGQTDTPSNAKMTKQGLRASNKKGLRIIVQEYLGKNPATTEDIRTHVSRSGWTTYARSGINGAISQQLCNLKREKIITRNALKQWSLK